MYWNLHCPSKKKSHTLVFCKRPPFTLIMEHICFSIVSRTFCNVTFISIQSCIHFWPRFCIDDRGVESFLQFFMAGKKSINGITWSFSTFRNSADLLCLDLTWLFGWAVYEIVSKSANPAYWSSWLAKFHQARSTKCRKILESKAITNLTKVWLVLGGGVGGSRLGPFQDLPEYDAIGTRCLHYQHRWVLLLGD